MKLTTTIALLGLCTPAHAADVWSHAQTMTVVMVDDRFEPDHLVFHSGQPYALRLENRGKDAHEFTAPEFLRAAKLRDRKVLANGGTEIYLPPGKSMVVFLVPPKPGTYKLTCADHDWDGMVGSITVD
jgi:uncharacterized cupredoxin-like copper-binding protein